MATKRCPDCRRELPASAFGRNRARPDGLSFYCRECYRERSNAHYRKRRASLGYEVRDHSWIPDGFRWCPACEQPVAQEDYSRNSRTRHGYGSRCKACKAAEDRAAYFYRKYGLTESELAAMRDRQNNRCLLCSDPGPSHVDHEHSSGLVRGLLCERCNLGLGLFRDDPGVLRRAARYVGRHSEPGTPRRGRRSPSPVAAELRRRAAGCPQRDVVHARVAALIASLHPPATG